MQTPAKSNTNSPLSHPEGAYTVFCTLFIFSHNPKYWCSLSLCVTLTTVVANGAVPVEIKNTESLQMTSLAAGNTRLPKVDIRFKSHNREPVFLTKEVLRKCYTAPQRRPEMGQVLGEGGLGMCIGGRPWGYVSYYHFLFLLVEDREYGLKEKGKRF